MSSDHPFLKRLQSVRGLAALTVAGAHSLDVLVFSGAGQWWRRALGNVFFGAGAVIVFFVLSGFVLGLTIERHSRYGWPECWKFIKRRTLRLGPAFIFFTCLFFAYYRLIYSPHDFRPVSVFAFEAPNASGISFLQNLLCYSSSLNGVTWSLRPEFLFSLLLPLTYLFTFRRPVLHFVVFGGLLLLFYVLPPELFRVTYVSAPYYMLWMLYGGSMIAFYRSAIAAAYRHVPKFILGTMVVAALGVCFTDSHFGNHFDHFAYAAGFIISVIALDALPAMFRFLDSRALISLGNISYSFYLLHPLCLIICSFLLLQHFSPAVSAHPWIGTLLLFTASTAMAIPLALLTYEWVESRFTSTSKKAK